MNSLLQKQYPNFKSGLLLSFWRRKEMSTSFETKVLNTCFETRKSRQQNRNETFRGKSLVFLLFGGREGCPKTCSLCNSRWFCTLYLWLLEMQVAGNYFRLPKTMASSFCPPKAPSTTPINSQYIESPQVRTTWKSPGSSGVSNAWLGTVSSGGASWLQRRCLDSLKKRGSRKKEFCMCINI